MLEPKTPRVETLDAFRKQFFRKTEGIGYEDGASSIGDFIETKEEEIENGFIMSHDRTLGLFIGVPKEGITRSLLLKYSEVEPEELRYNVEALEWLASWNKAIQLGEMAYDPKKVIKILEVIVDSEEDLPKIKTYTFEKEPVLLSNDYGEFVTIAPVIGRFDEEEIYTIEALEEKTLQEIRERRESLTDPDLMSVRTPSGVVNINTKEISEFVISVYWGDIRYHVTVADEDIEVTREAFEELRKVCPLVKVTDKREARENVDLERLTDDIEKLWMLRDPQIEEVDLYSKCLDDVIERIMYGAGLPCSLEFYVKHFGEEPPKTMNKYRSIFTPDEWCRAIIPAVLGHVTSIDIDRRTSRNECRLANEGIDFNCNHYWGSCNAPEYHQCPHRIKVVERGMLKIRFENIELPIPDIDVIFRKYNAKYLAHINSDVRLGDYDDWRSWEMKEKIREFEAESVRA